MDITLLGIVTDESWVQLANTPLPIKDKEVEIFNDIKLEQP